MRPGTDFTLTVPVGQSVSISATSAEFTPMIFMYDVSGFPPGCTELAMAGGGGSTATLLFTPSQPNVRFFVTSNGDGAMHEAFQLSVQNAP
ncbi:MAG: hypothetical protein RIT81_23100 [Deltaproteobacteria bacterium]